MKEIIVEVGSNNTKIHKIIDKQIEKYEQIYIPFKQNYIKDGKLKQKDINDLVKTINHLEDKVDGIFVCGTSIFRDLSENEQEYFLRTFSKLTGHNFKIVSQKEEMELTVYGSVVGLGEKACIFIGGGGSTEIAIYDKGIVEVKQTSLGVVDILREFPDLSEDIATTSIDEVKEVIKSKLNLPKAKADILILAGGAHEKLARYSGMKYKKNILYNNQYAPIMVDYNVSVEETKRFFYEISLDEIRGKSDSPEWWDATRVMCAFVAVVGESIEAKYLIPTNISMAKGIIEKWL